MMKAKDKYIIKEFLCEKQDNMCYYCSDFLPIHLLTIDHKKAIIKGGDSEIDNLVLCCRWCNQTKSNARASHFKKFVKFLDGKKPVKDALGRQVKLFSQKTGIWLFNR